VSCKVSSITVIFMINNNFQHLILMKIWWVFENLVIQWVGLDDNMLGNATPITILVNWSHWTIVHVNIIAFYKHEILAHVTCIVFLRMAAFDYPFNCVNITRTRRTNCKDRWTICIPHSYSQCHCGYICTETKTAEV
jgi:hypothetical protein